jgi:hypothetical protein
MIVMGRKIYARTLVERRMLLQLGGNPLRVPRGISPYMVVRRLARAVATESVDVQFVQGLLGTRPRKPREANTSTQQSEHASAPSPIAA